MDQLPDGTHLFLPQVKLTPWTDMCQQYLRLIPTDLPILSLPVLTNSEMDSIKADLLKMNLRPRLIPSATAGINEEDGNDEVWSDWSRESAHSNSEDDEDDPPVLLHNRRRNTKLKKLTPPPWVLALALHRVWYVAKLSQVGIKQQRINFFTTGMRKQPNGNASSAVSVVIHSVTKSLSFDMPSCTQITTHSNAPSVNTTGTRGEETLSLIAKALLFCYSLGLTLRFSHFSSGMNLPVTCFGSTESPYENVPNADSFCQQPQH